MSSVGDMLERKERPAYVRFERLAVEDKPASLAAGHYVAKDVDYALITPPYSKDIFKSKVKDWLADLEQQVRNDRINPEWVKTYKEAYRAWQNGQEIPLSGTPIRGWGVISPAQQETLTHMNVLTVEDLAAINDEGQKRIGMGAIELKNKAQAWLAQLNDKGPLTQEMAAVKAENANLTSSVETLTRQVSELTAMVRAQANKPLDEYAEMGTPIATISASAILVDDINERESLVKAYTAKFGKAPHHLAKAETIAKALE